ncbi:MAG: methyltransferase type 11 [Bacillota bacterium]|nr:MAG: methyltransferase type 11 [Bacillota bacterium]
MQPRERKEADRQVKEAVRQFFSRNAEAYARSPSHRSGADLARLIALLQPEPAWRALDAATAAGQTALALAPLVGEVVGLDLTPAHHFPDVPRAVAEMARVLRPGGRLGVVDMVAPGDPDAADLFNALERARDASHQRALSRAEWQQVIAGAGLRILALEVQADPVPLEDWLYPVSPDGPEAARVAALLAAAPPALRAQVVEETGSGFLYRKHRVILVAAR